MRLSEVAERDWPTVLTTAELAELTKIDRRRWFEVARGEAASPIDDVQPIRVGRRGVLRWPTVPVLRALRLDDGARVALAASPRPALALVASESPSSGGVADGSA